MKENPIIPSVPQATPADTKAITETSRDYIAGWFTADEERMQRCLHPQLIKRTIWHDLQQSTWQLRDPSNAEDMVNATRRGGGREMPEKAYEILILDVFRDIATVKVSSHPFMDYLHLAKINDRWLIVNCLWEVRIGEVTEP